MSFFQNYRNYGGGEHEIQHQEWRRYSANKHKRRIFPQLAMPVDENFRIISRERIFEEQIHQQFWTHSIGHPFSNRSTIGRRKMVLSSLRELPIDHHRPHFPPPIFYPPPPKCHFPPSPALPSKCNFVPHQQQDGKFNQENRKNVQIEHQTNKFGRMEKEDGGVEAKNVDPDEEIVNEQQEFQIRVEAKGFTDSDFKVSIDSSTNVLALDGEHFEENNGNGTVTIKKLNRRWKLADDIDIHSVRAFLAADGNVEIMGEKKKKEDDKDEVHFEERRISNEVVAKEDDEEEEEQLEMAAVMASIKSI